MEDTGNKPLVSIVIPCYNYGRFLSEAIESALNQTYHPVEVIVINDGSTDNTVEVASKYPVLLYNQENQGAAATYNRGIEVSKGEYVVILSADDKLHVSFIEKTLKVIESNRDIAFVYTYTSFFGIKEGTFLCREYNVSTLKISNYIMGTTLTRKDAFRIGGGFDPAFSCVEDWDLWLSFAENNLFGKLLPEPLFYYRQQTNSRNIFTLFQFQKNVFRIWKKHKKLYSFWDILKIILLGRLQMLIKLFEKILPILPRKTRRRIEKLNNKAYQFSGAVVIENKHAG